MTYHACRSPGPTCKPAVTTNIHSPLTVPRSDQVAEVNKHETKGGGIVGRLSCLCWQDLPELANLQKSLTLRAEWPPAAGFCSSRTKDLTLPDLILGQSGVQVAEDCLQIHCDDAHCHVLSELPG